MEVRNSFSEKFPSVFSSFCTCSAMDSASVFGTECWGFESLQVCLRALALFLCSFSRSQIQFPSGTCRGLLIESRTRRVSNFGFFSSSALPSWIRGRDLQNLVKAVWGTSDKFFRKSRRLSWNPGTPKTKNGQEKESLTLCNSNGFQKTENFGKILTFLENFSWKSVPIHSV